MNLKKWREIESERVKYKNCNGSKRGGFAGFFASQRGGWGHL